MGKTDVTLGTNIWAKQTTHLELPAWQRRRQIHTNTRVCTHARTLAGTQARTHAHTHTHTVLRLSEDKLVLDPYIRDTVVISPELDHFFSI